MTRGFGHGAQVRIDLIENFEALEEVERNWHAVYGSDPESHFFLSWPWLSQTLKHRAAGWRILAAHDGSDYVAFFPLRLCVRFSKRRGVFVNEIEMAGSFGWADYTGFICHPDHEAGAIPSLSARLLEMHWSKLDLRHLRLSDRRFSLFMSAFDEARFAVEDRAAEHETQSVNNEICPYVDLPDDFDRYLAKKVSANTRQKLRRLLRQVDGSADLRVTLATAETLERDLDVLAGFWRVMWADRKGEKVEHLAGRYREILRQGFEAGLLYMPVLWRRDVPLGALGSFIDRQKKELLYFVGGRDESSDDPPPGLVLHAHSIRWAIANGLRTYDFLRGNEAFKYSFGATDRRIRNIVVRTKTGSNLHDALDPACIDEVLDQAPGLEGDGRAKEAEAAYRQVLEACPDHPTALRRLATLLYGRNDYVGAQGICLRLAGMAPEDAAAWLLLGKAQLGMHEYAAAEASLRNSVDRDSTMEAHFCLARAFRGQGKEAEAAGELRVVLSVVPSDEKERQEQQRARDQLEQFEGG